MVGVAQLVRAPDCGSGGRRFNSGRPPYGFLRWKPWFVAVSEGVDTSWDSGYHNSLRSKRGFFSARCVLLERTFSDEQKR